MNKCRNSILSNCLVLYDVRYYCNFGSDYICNIRVFSQFFLYFLYFLMRFGVPNTSCEIYLFHIIYIRHFLLQFLARYVGFQVFLINIVSDTNIPLFSFSVFHYMNLIQWGFVVNYAYRFKTCWNFPNCLKNREYLSFFP